MTLYQIISEEFDNMGLVRIPHAVERLCTSLGCHLFNLNNLANKNFYHGGNLENFRLCVVFMVPSGYGKSQHFRFFLHPQAGILAESTIPISIRSTFSTESWMGTINGQNATRGVLGTYKFGIVGADDFMRLASLMSGTGVNNDEVYLMTALDSETVTKDLSMGSIEETDIGFTLWAGIRPTVLGLRQGLARRFSFQVFFPTVKDSSAFRQASRGGKMATKVSSLAKDKVRREIESLRKDLGIVQSLDHSEIEKWIDKQGYIPHFEESLFKRIALGWAVINGTIPDIILDDKLRGLLEDELWARDVIRSNPDHEAIKRILQANGEMERTLLITFMKRNYQLHKIQIDASIKELLRREELRMCGDNKEKLTLNK